MFCTQKINLVGSKIIFLLGRKLKYVAAFLVIILRFFWNRFWTLSSKGTRPEWPAITMTQANDENKLIQKEGYFRQTSGFSG